jgi:DNA-binding MarR family transcriptional regulator
MSDEIQTPNWLPLPPLMAEVKEAAIESLHRRLAEQGYAGIRPGHGCVFRFLDPEGLRLTDLAELNGLTKQSVGEFVADLERLGYVERVADPVDRRAKIIRLTQRGAEAKQIAQEFFVEIEGIWAEQIGEDRIAALRDALERIYELERSPAVPA